YVCERRRALQRRDLGVYDRALATGYGYVYPPDIAQPYASWVQRERSAYAAYRDQLAEGVTSRTLVRWRDSGISNDSYYLAGFNAGGRRVVDLSYWQATNRPTSAAETVEGERGDWLALTARARYEHLDLASAYDVTVGPDLGPADVDRKVVLPAPPDDAVRSVERPQRDDYGAYAQARLRRAHVFGDGDTHAL